MSEQQSLFNLDNEDLGRFYPRPQNREQLLVNIFALSNVKGIGEKTLGKLYENGLINKVWDLDKDLLQKEFQLISKRIPLNASTAITENKDKLISYGLQMLEHFDFNNFKVVFLGEHEYPKSLLTLDDPPKWLFMEGNAGLLNAQDTVGVIGSRDASYQGQKLAERFSNSLVERNIVVVSGMAHGIDEKAHYGAVNYYGQTIAILGYGFTANYASPNKHLWNKIIDTDGLIITEYLPDESPSREKYLRRNELQAALSKAIFPIEVPSLRSGTGATIRRAIHQKKPVIGIYQEGERVENLEKTLMNLKELNCKLFKFPLEENDFWPYLAHLLNKDKLEKDRKPRQQRFFIRLKNYLFKYRDVLSLNEEDVLEFADDFVSLLNEKSRK